MDTPTATPGRFRAALSALLTVAGAALLMLVAAEIGLRIFGNCPLYIADPVQGSVLRPNMRSRYARADVDQEILTNSHGFHDEEYPVEKAPGLKRVVVLGDSCMEALQVSIPDTFAKRMQRCLDRPDRRVQAINTGRSGRGCLENYLCLRTLGFPFQPDVAIFGFSMTDVDDDWTRRSLIRLDEQRRPVTFLAQGTIPLPLWLKRELHRSWAMYWLLEQGSLLWAQLRKGRAASAAGAASPSPAAGPAPAGAFRVLSTRYDAETEEAWKHTMSILRTAHSECRARGIRMMIMIVPMENQFDVRKSPTRDYWKLGDNLTDRPQQILREFGRAEGIPVLDLLEGFRASSVRPLHSLEGHWNVAGNDLAGQLACRFIERERLLDPAPATVPVATEQRPR